MGAALYLDSRIVGSIHDSSADWGGSWIDADPFRPVTGAHRQERPPAPGCAGRRGRSGAVRARPQGPGRYAGRLVCRALCQGAALHYVDAANGVKDFDVWSFYAQRADRPFPYRWRGHGGLRSLQNSAGIPVPPIVHRPSRGPARALTGGAAWRRPGHGPAPLPCCSTHRLRESAGGQGSRAHPSRADGRESRLAAEPFTRARCAR